MYFFNYLLFTNCLDRQKTKESRQSHRVGILDAIMSVSLLFLVAKVGIIFESAKFRGVKMVSFVKKSQFPQLA
jgi:hypothetical protein